MELRARIDRHRCIGAGSCIWIAPTAFDWYPGEYGKAAVVDVTSVAEEVLREAALACPTRAIEIEAVEELLPWQLRDTRPASSRRVVKTFMFTDIVGSTALVEAMGDEAWETLLAWHDQTLRALFAAHQGQEVASTGDGFFVGFDTPEAALAAAIAIQRKLADHRRSQGFAPQVRIGLHAAGATQVGRDFHGKGVHEARRIAENAKASEILATAETVAGTRYESSGPRTITLKGISDPVEVVSVDWR